MSKHAKVTVGQRALRARIKRVLTPRGHRLHLDRRANVLLLVDERRGTILAHDVSLEALARQLGVLRPFERLADD